MSKQPDFAQIFAAHFGGQVRKAFYKLRFDGSLLHDLQFMSTLVHDAVIHAGKIKKMRKSLAIPVTRECWEIPGVMIQGSKHLYVSEGRVVIKPVESLAWELPHRYLGETPYLLELKGLHLCSDYWSPGAGSFTLVLLGSDWRCSVKVGSKDPIVSLRDSTVPRLVSAGSVPEYGMFEDGDQL